MARLERRRLATNALPRVARAEGIELQLAVGGGREHGGGSLARENLVEAIPESHSVTLVPMGLLLALVHAASADAYQTALDTYTAGGKVDYAAIHAAHAFDPVVQSLASARVPADPKAAMSFWIDAYNAITIDLVADEWPLDSIRSLDGGKVWDTRKFVVAGKPVTLNDIENGILRPLGDPRVHAALNCASKGCPPLASQTYAGATLDTQLDAQSAAWMRTTGLAIDRAHGRVAISPIFDWYGDDFAKLPGPDVPGVDGEAEAAIRFALLHDPNDAAYLRAGGYAVAWADYDWGVNAK
jgi:hypothetical protein